MANPSQESKDAAAKSRIIKHMNADHQVSLSYYLQHFRKLPASKARSPLLEDISFDSMTIRTANGGMHDVPFNPPMKSWMDARERTVSMDREARDALNISDFQITEYKRPKSPFHVTIFVLCTFAYTLFVTQKRIVPGTWFYDQALPWFPGGPEWFLWTVSTIKLPTVGIHVIETVLLDRLRLTKYGLKRGSLLWWKWTVSVFIEGFGAFQRIDAMARKKREADKKDH